MYRGLRHHYTEGGHYNLINNLKSAKEELQEHIRSIHVREPAASKSSALPTTAAPCQSATLDFLGNFTTGRRAPNGVERKLKQFFALEAKHFHKCGPIQWWAS
jgi:hypothetical protein